MNFSLYSFSMAVLWSSIFISILLLSFSRRKKNLIMGFGVWPLLAIAVFSIIRCFFPLEVLSFTRVISNEGLFTQINTFLYEPIEGVGLSPLALLGLIWLAGFLVLFIKFLVKSIRYRMKLAAYEPADTDSDVYQYAQRTAKEAGVKNFRIYVDPTAETAALVGIFFPIVVVPHYPYTETDYRNIFLHEFSHWNNHDIWVKILVEFLHCVFWWNPLTYFLKKEVDQALEFKCDITVTSDWVLEDREAYVRTMQATLRFAKERWGNDDNDKKNGRKRRRSPIAIVEFLNTDDKGKKGLPGEFHQERAEVILWYQNNPKRVRTVTTITVAVMTCLMVFSYSFVVQPKYAEIPDEDLTVAGKEVYEVTPDYCYIFQDSDGRYMFFENDEFVQELPEEIAQEMIDGGFPFKIQN